MTRRSRTLDNSNHHCDLRSIGKEIQFLAASQMTWKGKKELENAKVVSLGGKPPKKQRLPLSIARVQMKKQKERELKMQAKWENLGSVGRVPSIVKQSAEKQKKKHKDKMMMMSDEHFRGGVLDVKHLFDAAASRENDADVSMGDRGRKKKNRAGKKKNFHGKKRTGHRKRH